jgi:hypothetical protein
MFLLVAVIAVVVFYLWLKGSRVKAEARHGLRWFRHSAGAPDGSVGTDWTFDFEAMSLVVTRFNSAPPSQPKEPTTHYTIRRGDDGAWLAKITEASSSDRLLWLSEVRKKPSMSPTLNERRDAEFLELDAGPREWKPLQDDLAGPVESQFQRFVRHYRV